MNDKPEDITLCLTDGDMIAYRAAFASQDEGEQECFDKVDKLIWFILDSTVVFPSDNMFKVFLTGKTNFRKSVDPSYKIKRKEVEKPKHLGAARQHLMDKWNAVMSDNCEADDLIAIAATEHNSPETTVISSLDKDFKTINCWLFNFHKNLWEYSTKEEALKFFYTQCLTGDTADGVVGVYKVGPAKAKKALEGCTTEEDLYKACLKVYEDNGMLEADLIRNARLLHLQRYENQLWGKPNDI